MTIDELGKTIYGSSNKWIDRQDTGTGIQIEITLSEDNQAAN
jgi:hypothetical protein